MPTLYIICGIPGSGKTTLVKNLPLSMMENEKLNIVESDEGRKAILLEYGFSETHQNNISDELLSPEKKRKIEDRVWEEIEATVKQILQSNEDIVIDATNTEQWILKDWFKFCKDGGHKSKVIIMSTPLDVCIERNNAREIPIPKEVMERMYNDYMMSVGWLYMEHSEKIINSAHL